MSGVHCERFPACMEVGMNATIPKCSKPDCHGNKSWEGFFAHFTPRADACEHDFKGWREHKDDQGRVMGGEQVCSKCGLGAMAYTLRTGL